ncbi:MAG: hypothetical protein AAGI38_21125 [Bacteroidota bacterium]
MLFIWQFVACNNTSLSRVSETTDPIQEKISWILDDSSKFSYLLTERDSSLKTAFGVIVKENQKDNTQDSTKFLASFYENGTINCIYLFTDLENVGDRTCFHRNGNPVTQGPMVDDLAHGEWNMYDQMGRIREKVWFASGEVVGGKTQFDTTGKTQKYCITGSGKDCDFLITCDDSTGAYEIIGRPIVVIKGKDREDLEEDVTELIVITAKSDFVVGEVHLLEKKFYDHFVFISLGEIRDTRRYILKFSPKQPKNRIVPIVLEVDYRFADSITVDTLEISTPLVN